MTFRSHLLQFTVWFLTVKMLLPVISFFLESTRKSASDHYRQWNGEWGLNSVDPGKGGTPLFSLYRYIVCAAEQGMVFKALSLKQCIQFHY